MRKFLWRNAVRGILIVFMSVLPIGSAISAEPLVDVKWVTENIGKPNVVFLDVRVKSRYTKGHIPGAVRTDYLRDGWRERSSNAPGVFPLNPEKLARRIGELGIGNNSHVVVVAAGKTSTDMAVASRIYWSFKVLGHDRVSILDGGMTAYQPKITGTPENPLETQEGIAVPNTFKPNIDQSMLTNENDVKTLLANGAVLVDNRTADHFLGINHDPKASIPGTIPGAVNLPHTWLTRNGGGFFHNKTALEKRYAFAGVPTNGKQVNFATTGDLATLGWFVSAEILGNKLTTVFDGSMIAWQANGLPVDTTFKE